MDKEKPQFSDLPENMKDEMSEKDSDELSIDKVEEEWEPPCVEKIAQLAQQHGFLSGYTGLVWVF